LLWWWLRRRHNALRHPAVGELAGLPAGKARIARWGPGVLRSLALLLLVVALAGPRWPDLRTRIETEGIAVVMLVDVSGSMAEHDFDWRGEPISRLEAVKKVFHLFVAGGDGPDATGDGSDASNFQGRPTDQIGLVTFATRPETACPLTLSHSVLLRLLEAEQPRRVPGESETNISDAVAMGLHRLRGVGPRRKVLVLLSDGEHNVPQPHSGWTPRQAAQVANGLHIPIYTIDAGGPGASSNEAPSREEGGLERTSSPGETRAQAVRTLREMAHITHAQSFQARDTKGLLNACRAIDALERSDLQSFQYRRYHEMYPWFGLAAFLLFSTALTLERTIWRRIP
jgi:Ca-activated chloride channel family protein